MGEIYLVRHGECEVSGDYKLGLTDAGRKQSEAVGEKLLARGVDNTVHLLTTHTARTRETAKIIQQKLGTSDPISHPQLSVMSEYPERISYIPMFDIVVSAIGTPIVSDIIFVTHAPLITYLVSRRGSSGMLRAQIIEF